MAVGNERIHMDAFAAPTCTASTSVSCRSAMKFLKSYSSTRLILDVIHVVATVLLLIVVHFVNTFPT
jgi:hypothetical protein